MKKQFTKQELKTIKARLRRLYNQANDQTKKEGRTWYQDAQNICKSHQAKTGNHFTLDQVAGVISALSPNNKWSRNIIDAFNVLQAVRWNKTPNQIKVCTFNGNKKKAFDLAQGKKTINQAWSDPNTAIKTASFVANIAHQDASKVTIDIWALRACYGLKKGPGDKPTTPTPTKYRQLEQLHKELAETISKEEGKTLTGYQLQAITWIQKRNTWSK